MERLSKASQCFVEIFLFSRCTTGTAGINAAEVDGPREAMTQISSARCPAAVLVGDVVLHTGTGIDFEFTRVDRTSQSLVVFTSIFVIGIAKRVIDVFLGPVDTQPLRSDLELLSRITVGQEGEHPNLAAVLAEAKTA